jgi:hypothetical protein
VIDLTVSLPTDVTKAGSQPFLPALAYFMSALALVVGEDREGRTASLSRDGSLDYEEGCAAVLR